jgi:hypothetical protein
MPASLALTRVQKYENKELRFTALLTEGGGEQLELARV